MPLTPNQKARHSGRWARIMTKWLITWVRVDRPWEIVNFTGPSGCESRGIVDFLAVRKDHRALEVARGDYFEMILIQVKGGRARWPTSDDIRRLRAVQSRYNARAVVLASWKPGARPVIYTLGPDVIGATPRQLWGMPTDARSLFK
jgi:hypothetical protein